MTSSTIDKIIEGNEVLAEGGVSASIKYIQRDIASINEKLDQKYVTKEEFNPVKLIVYGLTGLILATVFAALLYIVIRK